MTKTSFRLLPWVVIVLLPGVAAVALAQSIAHDPGVRGGASGAGGPISGLNGAEVAYFYNGLVEFKDVDGVGDGLGPRFNLDSCVGCHTQPAVGGSSPAVNPQVAVATAFG